MNRIKFSQSSVPKPPKKININEFMSKLYEIFEKYYFILRYLDYASFINDIYGIYKNYEYFIDDTSINTHNKYSDFIDSLKELLNDRRKKITEKNFDKKLIFFENKYLYDLAINDYKKRIRSNYLKDFNVLTISMKRKIEIDERDRILRESIKQMELSYLPLLQNIFKTDFDDITLNDINQIIESINNELKKDGLSEEQIKILNNLLFDLKILKNMIYLRLLTTIYIGTRLNKPNETITVIDFNFHIYRLRIFFGFPTTLKSLEDIHLTQIKQELFLNNIKSISHDIDIDIVVSEIQEILKKLLYTSLKTESLYSDNIREFKKIINDIVLVLTDNLEITHGINLTDDSYKPLEKEENYKNFVERENITPSLQLKEELKILHDFFDKYYEEMNGILSPTDKTIFMAHNMLYERRFNLYTTFLHILDIDAVLENHDFNSQFTIEVSGDLEKFKQNVLIMKSDYDKINHSSQILGFKLRLELLIEDSSLYSLDTDIKTTINTLRDNLPIKEHELKIKEELEYKEQKLITDRIINQINDTDSLEALHRIQTNLDVELSENNKKIIIMKISEKRNKIENEEAIKSHKEELEKKETSGGKKINKKKRILKKFIKSN